MARPGFKIVFSCAVLCEIIIMAYAFTAGYFYGKSMCLDDSVLTDPSAESILPW